LECGDLSPLSYPDAQESVDRWSRPKKALTGQRTWNSEALWSAATCRRFRIRGAQESVD